MMVMEQLCDGQACLVWLRRQKSTTSTLSQTWWTTATTDWHLALLHSPTSRCLQGTPSCRCQRGLVAPHRSDASWRCHDTSPGRRRRHRRDWLWSFRMWRGTPSALHRLVMDDGDPLPVMTSSATGESISGCYFTTTCTCTVFTAVFQMNMALLCEAVSVTVMVSYHILSYRRL